MDLFEKFTRRSPYQEDRTELAGISRRGFLKRLGLIAGAAGAVGLLEGCEDAPFSTSDPTATPIPTSLQYPQVPYTPVIPPEPGILRFFTPHEALTFEAYAARLLPGTPDDPGAREAGVVNYVDSTLAYPDGFVEKVYRQPPFAQVYEGDEPPQEEGDAPFKTIWVKADQIARYGYQSILNPRETMRIGLKALDAYSREAYDGTFASLNEAEQDEIIGAMLRDEQAVAPHFTDFSPSAFFHVMRRWTGEGMFADPAYGGNRDMAGWKLIGYPGAQRAYTPQEIITEDMIRPPQSMAMMHGFNPGIDVGEHVIMPVSGSDEHEHHH